MVDYKVEAAKKTLEFIKPGQIIGLGAGTTVANLVDLVKQNNVLVQSVTFVSSSFKTSNYLLQQGLSVQSPALIAKLDIYFDGCDQFDPQLNALKSGGGIHTSEKILASMANEFILMGDEAKFAKKLDNRFPLVIEVLPMAWPWVSAHLAVLFPEAQVKLRMSNQKDGALISEHGNFLADIYFSELPALEILNTTVKMIPGVVEHSLFCALATSAIVAGEGGTRIIIK
jgi:ribose 5-phosphate isomerase A